MKYVETRCAFNQVRKIRNKVWFDLKYNLYSPKYEKTGV